jgi:hypothetical protein
MLGNVVAELDRYVGSIARDVRGERITFDLVGSFSFERGVEAGLAFFGYVQASGDGSAHFYGAYDIAAEVRVKARELAADGYKVVDISPTSLGIRAKMSPEQLLQEEAEIQRVLEPKVQYLNEEEMTLNSSGIPLTFL